MPYSAYKLMHYVGIFAMLVVFTLACAHALRDGARADRRALRGFWIGHGVAALLILTGGFGMLARLGSFHGELPGWILLKLAIWLVLAGAIALPSLDRRLVRWLPVAVPLAALAAAATAIYKPFTG